MKYSLLIVEHSDSLDLVLGGFCLFVSFLLLLLCFSIEGCVLIIVLAGYGAAKREVALEMNGCD